MNVATKKAVIAEMIKAGRPDLANAASKVTTAAPKAMMNSFNRMLKNPKDSIGWMKFLGEFEAWFDRLGGASSTQEFSTIKKNIPPFNRRRKK